MRTLALTLSILCSVVAAAPAAARPVAFDLAHSKMTVHVSKQGVFSFLADDHIIDAPFTSGSFDATAKSVEFTVDATKMRVLDPRLPAQKREAVQGNMTGGQVLDAARYPTITFRSTTIDEAEAGHWTVTGMLTLRGESHPLSVRVQRTDPTHFTGSATVRQTTFGITPIKVAGGAVSVKDDVEVEFEIALSE